MVIIANGTEVTVSEMRKEFAKTLSDLKGEDLVTYHLTMELSKPKGVKPIL